MKKEDHTLKSGLLMFLFISLFFLLMKGFNLESYSELRFFNLLIVVYFSNRMAKYYINEGVTVDYFSAFRSVFLANVIAVVLSVIAMALYLAILNPNFQTHFKQDEFLGNGLFMVKVSTIILLEGMTSSIVVSIAILQYRKENKRSKKVSNLLEIDM